MGAWRFAVMVCPLLHYREVVEQGAARLIWESIPLSLRSAALTRARSPDGFDMQLNLCDIAAERLIRDVVELLRCDIRNMPKSWRPDYPQALAQAKLHVFADNCPDGRNTARVSIRVSCQNADWLGNFQQTELFVPLSGSR